MKPTPTIYIQDSRGVSNHITGLHNIMNAPEGKFTHIRTGTQKHVVEIPGTYDAYLIHVSDLRDSSHELEVLKRANPDVEVFGIVGSGVRIIDLPLKTTATYLTTELYRRLYNSAWTYYTEK